MEEWIDYLRPLIGPWGGERSGVLKEKTAGELSRKEQKCTHIWIELSCSLHGDPQDQVSPCDGIALYASGISEDEIVEAGATGSC